MKQIPEGHDCKKSGCFSYDDNEPDFHNTIDGFCLACYGCGDPECCGGHDDNCLFEPIASRIARRNSNTVEEGQDT